VRAFEPSVLELRTAQDLVQHAEYALHQYLRHLTLEIARVIFARPEIEQIHNLSGIDMHFLAHRVGQGPSRGAGLRGSH